MNPVIPIPSTIQEEAAVAGDTELIKELLQKSKKIDEQNPENWWTPLMFAVARGHMDAVKLLVESGADVNKQTFDGKTPRALALLHRKSEINKYLGEKGGEFGHITSLMNIRMKGDTQQIPKFALHTAVQTNNIPVFINLLGRLDVDVNEKDEYSKTPLMYAVIRSNKAFIRKLLMNGADPTIEDENKNNSFRYTDSNEILSILLKYKKEKLPFSDEFINPKPQEYVSLGVGAGGSGVCSIHGLEHNDGRKLYTFVHRQLTGLMYDHNGKSACLQGVLENPTPHVCPLDSTCKGMVYPTDIEGLVSEADLATYREAFKISATDKSPVYVAFGHGVELLEEYESRGELANGYTLVVAAQCDVQTWTHDIYDLADKMINNANVSIFSNPTKKELKALTGIDYRIYREGDKIPQLAYRPFGIFDYGVSFSGIHKLPIQTSGMYPSNIVISADELGTKYKQVFSESTVFPDEETLKSLIHENNTDYTVNFSEVMSDLGPGVYYFPVCRNTGVEKELTPIVEEIASIFSIMGLKDLKDTILATNQSISLPSIEKAKIIADIVKKVLETRKWGLLETNVFKTQLEELVEKLGGKIKPIERIRSKSTERQRQIAGLRKNGKKKTRRKKHHGVQTYRYHR